MLTFCYIVSADHMTVSLWTLAEIIKSEYVILRKIRQSVVFFENACDEVTSQQIGSSAKFLNEVS